MNLTTIYKRFYNHIKLRSIIPAIAISIVLVLATSGETHMSPWNDRPALTGLSEFPSGSPASFSPLLTWQKDTEAVMYEIEFFDHMPSGIRDDDSSEEAIWRSHKIYQNQYNPDLASFAENIIGKKPLYWRVRSLGLNYEPLTPYSQLAVLYTSPALKEMDSPVALSYAPGAVPLLYPVYHWVPQHDAATFIVSVYSTNPDVKPDAVPLETMKTDAAEIYDQKPRYSNHPFYWKVQAYDAAGNPLGKPSKTISFTTSPEKAYDVAVLGDSISHGGGHISFGPADVEFSWPDYLTTIRTVNLSMSGDTIETMLDRFDRDVLPFHPRYLLIFDGTNSLRAGADAQQVIDAYKELSTRCKAAGIRPIFMTLPPINPQNIWQAFQEITADDWSEQFEIVNAYIRTQPHIDSAAAFGQHKDLPTEYALDGIHEDVSGKQLIAQAVEKDWPHAKAAADNAFENQ